jgi:hypothetical protein
MIHARWFGAEWNVTLRALAARMRARAFTEETPDGFLLERSREDHIEGRYIEKMSYQETIPDPFGHELTFDRVTYREVNFTIYREFPQLELRNPPRSMQAFMSRLSELTDFSVATATLSVDVMRWAELLRVKLDTQMVMDTVQLSAVTISSEVTATIVLRSERDVRESIPAIAKGRTYTVDKVRLKWHEQGRLVAIQLRDTASANLDEGNMELLPMLRATLPKSN